MADWLIWGAVFLCWCMVWGWGTWGWASHRQILRHVIRVHKHNAALWNTALALACLVPTEKQDKARELLETVLGPADPLDGREEDKTH